MLAQEIIRHKRDGHALDRAQIDAFVGGLVDASWSEAQAASLMLRCIADDAQAAGRVGFKPSGGIRTVAEAAVYIALCEQVLGRQAVQPRRFRFGASGLLNDIEALLSGRSAPPKPAPGSY